jgi:hypothetical protein
MSGQTKPVPRREGLVASLDPDIGSPSTAAKGIEIYRMAAKKKSKSAFGAKAAFVRSVARETPAKEVVAQAAKKGVKLTENYVYTVRSSSGATKAAKGKPGPKPGRGKASAGEMSAAEAQLRDAIADLGLVTAARILESVKATIKGG